jgi:cytochrome c55X
LSPNSLVLTKVKARQRRARESVGVKFGIALLLGMMVGTVQAGGREDELIRLVRQDCGSCHGMRLTGGLGLPLTPESLRDKPVESLVATIVWGRPGTAMPPWKSILNEQEAEWIVRKLLDGFPEETR